MNNLRLAATLFAGAALLAGCQQVPAPAPAPVAPPPAPAPAEPPPAEPMAPAVVPYPAVQIPKAILNAMSLLDTGKEDVARGELQRILAGDPNNAKAKHLMSQITGDPVAMLGKDSFAYTVRPNESMSTIAGRFLGDITSFYVLARYNGIVVPRQLAAGQVLRIPGKAPPLSALSPPAPPSPASAPTAETPAPPPAAPVPPPAPQPSPGARALQQGQAAEARGDLEAAYGAYQQAAVANEPGAPARVDAVRKKLVQRYSLGARTAFARQDLDGAIKGWDSVLAVDPDNETAKLERQRALTLKAKVDSLKK